MKHTDYKILFKFPVRSRKEKFFSTLEKYYELISNNMNFEFVITMDLDDEILNTADVKRRLNGFKNLTYFYGNSKTKIEAVNSDMPLGAWDIVVLVSDDMIPQVKGYDDVIRKDMFDNYKDTDGVLWYNDGSVNGKLLNTLLIIGRKCYKRFGYLYNPIYKSLCCDAEFMDVANQLKKQTYFDSCIIKHEHFVWGFGEKDELYKNCEFDFPHDKKLYLQRKATGYKETNIPKNAFFIWSKNTPLSYLRYLTLETFRALHPDYKMHLYLAETIEQKNWQGREMQEYFDKEKNEIKDYLPKVSELGVNVYDYNKYSNLNPTQIADIFRFEVVHEFGGWFFDLDQLFLNSIESVIEKQYEQEFIFGGKTIAYIGVIGGAKGNEPCRAIGEKQQAIIKQGNLNNYQSLGVHVLWQYLNELQDKKIILQVDDDVFYPVLESDNAYVMYNGTLNLSLLRNSVAVHWFGGHPVSQVFNKQFNEDFTKTSKDSISKWLRKEVEPTQAEVVFTEIFLQDIWNENGEYKGSVSGSGSCNEQTATLQQSLPELFKQYEIKSILDAPCGDFYWFKNINLENIEYLGVDIVDEVLQLAIKNTKQGVSFKKLDIIEQELPCVDLIICRDCLVHFSYESIRKTIKNFKDSGSKYLLTTSFTERITNIDIPMGRWRPLNLNIAPFGLKHELVLNENCTEGNGMFKDKSLLLFDLTKIEI